jgi:hypothetical protein
MTLEHKIDACTLLAAGVALFTRNEEITIGVLCAVGGIISGYCGARLFPAVKVDFRTRWLVNFCTAVLFGPVASVWVIKNPFFEGYPSSSLVIATAGVLGVCGVSILLIIVPLMRGVLSVFISRYGLKKDGENGEGN